MGCCSALSTCSTRTTSLLVLAMGLVALGYGFVMLDMLLIPITGVVSGTHVC